MATASIILAFVNFLGFGFIFTIWSRKSVLNQLVKFLFFVLSIVNLGYAIALLFIQAT